MVDFIPTELRIHIVIFRIFGMWPPEKPSFFYNLLSYLTFFLVGLAFPVSLLWNVFFVGSVDKILDHLFISSSASMALIKATNVWVQQSKLRKLFQLHHQMLEKYGENQEEMKVFQVISKDCSAMLKFFTVTYMSAWATVGLQSAFSVKEKRLWPSTSLLPFDFAQQQWVYLFVISCQCYQNFCHCLLTCVNDTYPVFMIKSLSGHIEILRRRLRALGIGDVKPSAGVEKLRKVTNREQNVSELNQRYYREIIDCVKEYESCLGLVPVLNHITYVDPSGRMQ